MTERRPVPLHFGRPLDDEEGLRAHALERLVTFLLYQDPWTYAWKPRAAELPPSLLALVLRTIVEDPTALLPFEDE